MDFAEVDGFICSCFELIFSDFRKKAINLLQATVHTCILLARQHQNSVGMYRKILQHGNDFGH